MYTYYLSILKKKAHIIALKTNQFSHSPKSDVIDDAMVIRAIACGFIDFATEINTIMPSNWTSRSIVQLSYMATKRSLRLFANRK